MENEGESWRASHASDKKLVEGHTALWKSVLKSRADSLAKHAPESPFVNEPGEISTDEAAALMYAILAGRDEVHEDEIDAVFKEYAKIKRKCVIWDMALRGLAQVSFDGKRGACFAPGALLREIKRENPDHPLFKKFGYYTQDDDSPNT